MSAGPVLGVDPGIQGAAVWIEDGPRPRVLRWVAWHPLGRGWSVSASLEGAVASAQADTLGAVAEAVGRRCQRGDLWACEGLWIPSGRSPGPLLALVEAAGRLLGAAEVATGRAGLRPQPSEWRRQAWGSGSGTAAEAKAAALKLAPLRLDWTDAPLSGSLVACEREGIAEAAGIALWLLAQPEESP